MHQPNQRRGLDGVQTLLIFGGFLCFMGACVAAFGGVDLFLFMSVQYIVKLSQGSMVWDMWKEYPEPIYLKFHMFNITNADRLPLGEKPTLQEMGPYTYLLKLRKREITVDAKTDTIRYRQPRRMYFQRKLSNGTENDEITYINMIFLSVSHMANDMTEDPEVLETLDNMLTERGEKVTRTSTVAELLFTGVSIQAYVDLVEDPAVQASGKIELPEKFADGKFAFFKNKNGSDEGWWVVKSGVRNYKQMARIVSIDDEKESTYWQGDNCNKFNGSDGLWNPPFQIPGVTKLYAYWPDLCRSIKWRFVNNTIVGGTFLARYTLPDFVTPDEDPDSWCFCPYRDSNKGCNIRGLASLQSCYGGAPIMVSKPHFYNADPKLLKAVVGLKPNKEKHESVLDIHSYTGMTMHGRIRTQFSIQLMNWTTMPSFKRTYRSMVPLVWIEQSVEQDSMNLVAIRILETFRRAWPTLKYMAILMTIGIIFGGFALVYKSRNENDLDEYMGPISSTNIEVLAKDFATEHGENYQTEYSNLNGRR